MAATFGGLGDRKFRPPVPEHDAPTEIATGPVFQVRSATHPSAPVPSTAGSFAARSPHPVAPSPPPAATRPDHRAGLQLALPSSRAEQQPSPPSIRGPDRPAATSHQRRRSPVALPEDEVVTAGVCRRWPWSCWRMEQHAGAAAQHFSSARPMPAVRRPPAGVGYGT